MRGQRLPGAAAGQRLQAVRSDLYALELREVLARFSGAICQTDVIAIGSHWFEQWPVCPQGRRLRGKHGASYAPGTTQLVCTGRELASLSLLLSLGSSRRDSALVARTAPQACRS